MKQPQSQPKGVSLLRSSIAAAFILSVAIACETPNNPSVSNSVARVAQTPTLDQLVNPSRTQSYVLTPTPTINPANATFIAVKLTEIYIDDHFPQIKETALAGTATVIALTPTYTPTPTMPTPTMGPPEPTPTLQMGIVDCGADTAGFPYLEYNCWRGSVNGRGTFLSAGRERVGAGGDPSQGFLLIYYPLPSAEYKTPSKSGTVKIVSVNGTRVNLMATDPDDSSTTFTFNLATHQFETQSGTPIPTTPVAP